MLLSATKSFRRHTIGLEPTRTERKLAIAFAAVSLWLSRVPRPALWPLFRQLGGTLFRDCKKELGRGFRIEGDHFRGDSGRKKMSIVGWIVLGLVAGFVASKIVNKQGEGLILDIVLSIVGAIVGGYVFSLFGGQGVNGVNIYSMFVAAVGAIIVLVIYPSVTGRRAI